MLLDKKHIEVLRDAHRLLREAESKLAHMLEYAPDCTLEEFDEVCDTLNTAGARLRYVRVFNEPTPDDDVDDTLP